MTHIYYEYKGLIHIDLPNLYIRQSRCHILLEASKLLTGEFKELTNAVPTCIRCLR